MKKLITLAVIFVLTSIMIGCKSSSVLKRRYTKGYYVHHAARHNETKPAEKTAVLKQVKPVPIAAAEQAVSIEPQQRALEQAPVVTAGVDLQNKKETAVSVTKKNTASKVQIKDLKVLPTAFSMQKQFKLIKSLKDKVTADAADDALSLLWIIILILLIFYLLGFAFDMYGIGPLFNLLALIIVILLILWLLRIL